MKVSDQMIGRANEISILKYRLEQAIDGKGSFVLIEGEAGIGKTRLVEELSVYARSRDMLVLSGQCLYHEGTDPYLPFIEALREYFKKEPEDIPKKIAIIPISAEGPTLTDIFNAAESEVSSSRKEVFSRDRAGGPGYPDSVETKNVQDEFQPILQRLPMWLIPVTHDTKYSKFVKGKDYKTEREKMFDTVLQLIISISHRKPLLLFLDDLHWADHSSIQLLLYIVRAISRERVLVVGTYRPEDLSDTKGVHPLTEMLQRASKEKLYTLITLNRLNPKEMLSFTIRALNLEPYFEGAATQDEKLVSLLKAVVLKLYQHTDGNPFYFIEVLSSLKEDNLLEGPPHETLSRLLKVFEEGQFSIPRSVNDLIVRRLARLDEKTSELIEYIAVMGNEFTLPLLERVILGRGPVEKERAGEITDDKDIKALEEETRLVEMLETLVKTRLIKEVSNDNYVFDHPVIQEIIYNNLSKTKKRLLHRKIAYSLEKTYQDNIEAIIYHLARHFYFASDYEKASLYSTMAGRKAALMYAFDEAVSYYNMALYSLGHLESSDERERRHMAVLFALGHIHQILGNWDMAVDNFTKAIDFAQRLPGGGILEESYLALGEIFGARQEWDRAKEYYQKAFETGLENENKEIVFEALRGQGRVEWQLGNLDKAEEYFQSCEKFLDDKDYFLKAHLTIDKANVIMDRGDFEKTKVEYSRALELLKRCEENEETKRETARLWNNFGVLYTEMGNLEEAVTAYRRAIGILENIGGLRLLGFALSNLGEVLVKTGKPVEAAPLLERAQEIFAKIDDRYMTSTVYMYYGQYYFKIGKVEQGKESYDRAKEILENLKMIHPLGVLYYEEANSYLFHKMYNEASKSIRSAIEMFTKSRSEPYLVRAKKLEEEITMKMIDDSL